MRSKEEGRNRLLAFDVDVVGPCLFGKSNKVGMVDMIVEGAISIGIQASSSHGQATKRERSIRIDGRIRIDGSGIRRGVGHGQLKCKRINSKIK